MAPFRKCGGKRLLTGATLAFLSCFVAARDAFAYCQTSICELGNSGAVCTPALESDCGLPLFWKERCIGFSVQKDGSQFFSSELLAGLVSQAFTVWTSAECDEGGRPQLFVTRQADAECAFPEYNIDRNVNKGNANVVMFRDEGWPYPGFEDTFALTTLTYHTETGEIYDADIEINTADVVFTTSDSDIVYDLASTIQHETGHFLGIAHSPEVASPMFPLPEFGITRRELSPDDVAAICNIYPPEAKALDASCSPVPHDFSPLCNHTLAEPSEAEDGCSASRAPAGGGTAVWLALASFAASARRRRRRSS